MVHYPYELSDEAKEKNQKSEERFLKKKDKAILFSENLRRRNELREIRNQFKSKKFWKRIRTTKILMIFIFANCTIVELYSMLVMFKLQDLSALYSLITAVVGEAIAFAIYSVKSFNETKEEQRLAFDREKFSAEFDLNGEPIDEVPEDDDHSGDIPEGDEVMMESEEEE